MESYFFCLTNFPATDALTLDDLSDKQFEHMIVADIEPSKKAIAASHKLASAPSIARSIIVPDIIHILSSHSSHSSETAPNGHVRKNLHLHTSQTNATDSFVINVFSTYAYADEGDVFLHEVTLDSLARILDASKRYWSMVAYVCHFLGLDPASIPYQGSAASFVPSIYPSKLVASTKTNQSNQSTWHATITPWFNYHGYACSCDPGLQTKIVRFETRSPNLISYVFVIMSDQKPGRKPGTIAADEMRMYSDIRTSQDYYQSPIFYITSIPNFDAEWTETIKSDHNVNFYPAELYYFNMGVNDNVFFPRLVPQLYANDILPKIYPGPAMYCWKSAPEVFNRTIFALPGPKGSRNSRGIALIRGTCHPQPINFCPIDPAELA